MVAQELKMAGFTIVDSIEVVFITGDKELNAALDDGLHRAKNITA
jgi:hypothetical protein